MQIIALFQMTSQEQKSRSTGEAFIPGWTSVALSLPLAGKESHGIPKPHSIHCACAGENSMIFFWHGILRKNRNLEAKIN